MLLDILLGALLRICGVVLQLFVFPGWLNACGSRAAAGTEARVEARPRTVPESRQGAGQGSVMAHRMGGLAAAVHWDLAL